MKSKEILEKEPTERKGTGEEILTSSFGQPVPCITRCLNVNGFIPTSDVFLMEKQQTFNRAKTLERMVHPCGSGAYGYFEVTNPDLPKFTKAKFLSQSGKRTPVFVRFSTVTYGREFPDSGRNPRGFAIKFYTEDGNYDLVGLNFPVFFNRDPAIGPDVIRSQQRNPSNFLLNFDAMFDLFSLVPESLHAATMLFSDHGTPYGFRHMHGYGCHTFKWVNDQGMQFYVKYHFEPDAGVKNFTWEEAVRMSGEDPDFAKRDLWETIERGEEVSWTAYIQMMPASEAPKARWDPFDVTKVWSKHDYPLVKIGRLVLNKNPKNYHAEVEQAAFSPGSLVPGIEPSPDPLLQFRMFFYRDAQYHRLGTNLHQIPVNCPFRAQQMGAYHPFTRDGKLRVDDNGGNEPNYFPNSFGGPKTDFKQDWQPVKVNGILDRSTPISKHEGKLEDELEQVRELYSRVMKEQERKNLHKNMAAWLKYARHEVQMRMLAMLLKIHNDYAKGVYEELARIKGAETKIVWKDIQEQAEKTPMMRAEMAK